MEEITFTDKMVVASQKQLSADMQGESVILNIESGIYFGLTEAGTRIWELVQQPISVRAIQETILNEYDVDAGRCAQDIQMLLTKLFDARLLEVLDAEAS